MAKRIATPNIKRSYYTRRSLILTERIYAELDLAVFCGSFVVVVVVVLFILFVCLFVFICHYFAGYILTPISY